MTKTFHRMVLGATAAVLAAGGSALAATPAFAVAPPHVSVALSSGTVAPGANKFIDVVITNNGADEITGLRLVIDESGVDQTKVNLYHHKECTPATGAALSCPLDVTTLGAGQKATWGASIYSVGKNATGPAGHLDARVEWSGGGKLDQSFPLTVAGHGPDLRVETPDAPQMLDNDGNLYVGKLGPGETGSLVALFENFGDAPAGGLVMHVNLPAGAVWDYATIDRFPEDYVGCTFARDHNRIVECNFGGLVLNPPDQQTATNPWLWGIGFPIKLDKTAKSGVNLRGGTAVIDGSAVPVAQAKLAKKAAADAPRGTLADGDVALPTEVDGKDNRSGFAVLVKTFGQGGGHTGGGTGTGGTGTGGTGTGGSTGTGSGGTGGTGGGGLPVTGPVAASVGAAGAAVVLAGVLLFLITRRRRVVLVTPEDEGGV